MGGAEVLIPISILAFLAVLIALGVFMVIRVRSGEGVSLSFRTILLVYLYLMSIASFLVFTAGLSIGIKALLSDAFGREFSYYLPAIARPVPIPQGKEVITPSHEEQTAQAKRQADRQYKDDLIQGTTLTVLGALIWGLHRYGRRRVQDPSEVSYEFFNKAYAAILLAIFGIAGIITLTSGVYEVLRYFLIEADEFNSRQSPGGSIASAIVFVPCWLYYLMAVMGQSRRETASSEV